MAHDNTAKIPAHFGDIMSVRETSLTLPDGFTGLERILITANGNLQRILSAYFNEPVTIEILRNESLGKEELANIAVEKKLNSENNDPILRAFDREVNLVCKRRVVTNAISLVIIRDKKILDMVENEGVGIGQIFRYLDKLPKFELLSVGRSKEGPWWRDYSLKMGGVECYIRETFSKDVLVSDQLQERNSLENEDKQGEQLATEWIFGKDSEKTI